MYTFQAGLHCSHPKTYFFLEDNFCEVVILIKEEIFINNWFPLILLTAHVEKQMYRRGQGRWNEIREKVSEGGSQLTFNYRRKLVFSIGLSKI